MEGWTGLEPSGGQPGVKGLPGPKGGEAMNDGLDAGNVSRSALEVQTSGAALESYDVGGTALEDGDKAGGQERHPVQDDSLQVRTGCCISIQRLKYRIRGRLSD